MQLHVMINSTTPTDCSLLGTSSIATYPETHQLGTICTYLSAQCTNPFRCRFVLIYTYLPTAVALSYIPEDKELSLHSW